MVDAATDIGVASNANPSSAGQAVTFTATVTDVGGGTPTGMVEFYDGSTDLGPGSALAGAGGSAASTFTTSALPVGADAIRAVYTPVGAFLSGSGSVTQTVDAITSVGVASGVNPSAFGQAVTFTATVTNTTGGGGAPTGTVEFYDGAADLGPGSVLAGGGDAATSTLTISTLGIGNHTIEAVYTPAGDFTNGNGSTTQTVDAVTNVGVASDDNPSLPGQAITFTATVTNTSGGATPTGTVEFYDGSTDLGPGSALTGGAGAATSALTISTLSKGAHTIRAVYAPTGFFFAGSGALSQTVGLLTGTAVVSGANPSAFGQAVTITATVTNTTNGVTPTGAVEFFDGATDLGPGSALTGGGNTATSTLTISTLALGNHSIEAVFTGTGAFADSSGGLTQTVDAVTGVAVSSTNGASTFGEAVVLTATVTDASNGGGTPTGHVEFFDGATDLGPGSTLTGNGASATSTLTVSTLGVGSHAIRAVYTPTGNFLGGNASLTQTVDADPGTAVLKTDGSLWQFGPTGALQLLSPAGTILAVSTANDAAGNADVFAITANRQLWEHTPAGWALLSTGSFRQVSAARNSAGNAVAFAVVTDDSLWEYSSLYPGGWAMLSPAGTIQSVSAVTDAAGHDDAFAVTAVGNLWEHSPDAGWAQLSVGSFRQVSAGLSASGQAVAYGVLTDESLWEYNPALAGGWQLLSGSGTILSASAGGADEVFAITADQHLWDYRMGNWSLESAGAFASISGTEAAGAGHGELFAVLADSSAWEFDPLLPGDPWVDLLASGAAAAAAPR